MSSAPARPASGRPSSVRSSPSAVPFPPEPVPDPERGAKRHLRIRTRRNRAGRRGGQLLTRARGSSKKNGLPTLLLPVPLSRTDAPHADQRPTTRRVADGTGDTGAVIPVTNLVESINARRGRSTYQRVIHCFLTFRVRVSAFIRQCVTAFRETCPLSDCSDYAPRYAAGVASLNPV